MVLGLRDKNLLLRYPTKNNHKRRYQVIHQAKEHRRNEKWHIVHIAGNLWTNNLFNKMHGIKK
jgi:hypothetical protein